MFTFSITPCCNHHCHPPPHPTLSHGFIPLADSQCAKAERYHHGWSSMRTVHSYLSHHRASIGSSLALSISENLTNSLVDFKVRELVVVDLKRLKAPSPDLASSRGWPPSPDLRRLKAPSLDLENASVERMETVVCACVEGLGSTSVEVKREALGAIPTLYHCCVARIWRQRARQRRCLTSPKSKATWGASRQWAQLTHGLCAADGDDNHEGFRRW
ncbi:hypothetical protein Cni_G03115 [Canna indica]|uniref:Uncharacterized protein n=1 Tax=Canna indica TaxID=4628 RepID=A0AAQ3JQL5_9LILI|nr:hypothetical protein Cni_G03115 [Canna indica]